jgi:phosphatidylserine/phosphatidylglycerophosphate/cardiolipin synthase-like enzyme
MIPVRTVRSLRLPALVSALLLAAATAVSAAPTLELIETRPVETTLGNPEIREAAGAWVEAIAAAKQTIDMEHFYLSDWPGEPTGPVIDALTAATKRGVRVRLILDARMHTTYPRPADSLGTLPNFEVRTIDMKQVSGGGIQHAKLFVIDGAEVIVGSQNFDWRALKHIHELGVRLREPHIATEFARLFESDWAVSTPVTAAKTSSPATSAANPPAKPMSTAALGDAPANTAASATSASWRGYPMVRALGDTAWVRASFCPIGHIPAGSASDRDVIVGLIDGAKRDVVVQLLTYGNGRATDRDTTIDTALRRAAGRGVQVRLVVSDWEADNGRIADLQALTRVPNIHVKLSHVPEWSGGYIPFGRVEHCKYMVVDLERTWVGTSNWEPDYFRSSRNAAITISDPTIAARARRIFMASWDEPHARALTPDLQVEKRVHGDTPPPGGTVYGK